MINDVIELKMNDNTYNARLDMGAIANAQHNLQKFKKNILVSDMFDEVKSGNYLVLNNILIESIKRCHPQLKDESILENMKIHERDELRNHIFQLMEASLPEPTEEDKKKVVE